MSRKVSQGIRINRSFISGLLMVGCIAAIGGFLNFHQTQASTTNRIAKSMSVKIMPLGDSITQGNKDHNSYRRSLWQRLQQAGYPVNFVGSQRDNHEGPPPNPDFDRDHEGHWGWRIDEILPQVKPWAQAAKPDIVLVHLGTNDLAQQQDRDETVNELKQVVLTLREVNPRVKVLIAEIIPLIGNNERFSDYNTQVRQMVQGISTAQSPVVAVDQFTGFEAEPNQDTFDGCHPNESGEKKMAERWLAALVPFLK